MGVGATTLDVRYRGVIRSVAILVPPEADGAPALTVLAPTGGAVLVVSRVTVRGVVSPPTAEVLVDGRQDRLRLLDHDRLVVAPPIPDAG